MFEVASWFNSKVNGIFPKSISGSIWWCLSVYPSSIHEYNQLILLIFRWLSTQVIFLIQKQSLLKLVVIGPLFHLDPIQISRNFLLGIHISLKYEYILLNLVRTTYLFFSELMCQIWYSLVISAPIQISSRN